MILRGPRVHRMPRATSATGRSVTLPARGEWLVGPPHDVVALLGSGAPGALWVDAAPEGDVTPAMSDRPDPGSPRYLTVPECARALRVSEWFIRERIADGSLRALVVTAPGGRRILRIRPEDWAAFRARFTGNATDRRFE